MKHIKKRFFFDYKENELKLNENSVDFCKFDGEHEKRLIGKKGSVAFLELEDEQYIGGIVNKMDGKNFIIPIPEVLSFSCLQQWNLLSTK